VGYFIIALKFTAKSVGERILKIDRYLAKFEAKIYFGTFSSNRLV